MLNSPEIQDACLDEAQKIEHQAMSMTTTEGGRFRADVRAGRNRAQARVIPDNKAAWRDTLRDNILLKAAGGAS